MSLHISYAFGEPGHLADIGAFGSTVDLVSDSCDDVPATVKHHDYLSPALERYVRAFPYISHDPSPSSHGPMFGPYKRILCRVRGQSLPVARRCQTSCHRSRRSSLENNSSLKYPFCGAVSPLIIAAPGLDQLVRRRETGWGRLFWVRPGKWSTLSYVVPLEALYPTCLGIAD